MSGQPCLRRRKVSRARAGALDAAVRLPRMVPREEDSLAAKLMSRLADLRAKAVFQGADLQVVADSGADLQVVDLQVKVASGGGPPGGGGFGGGPPGEGGFGGGPPGGGPPGGGPPGGGGFQGGGPPGGGGPQFGNEEFRAQFEKMRQAMDKIRTSATKQLTDVLTAEQQAAFKKLQGKSFNLASLRPGAGNGPGSSTRTNRTTGRTKAQTKQRSRRDTEENDPGMENQPGSVDPQ